MRGLSFRSMLFPAAVSLALFAFAPHAGAEILAPPPYGPMDMSEARGALPESRFWTRLRRFHDDFAEPDHNYHFDVGAFATLWADGTQAVEANFRAIYQSKTTSPAWSFQSSAFVNEIGVRYRRRLGPGMITGYYRHDSKHDLDMAIRRIPVHDALGVEYQITDSVYDRLADGTIPPEGFGYHGGFLRFGGEARIPHVFETPQEEEPYEGRLTAEAEVEPYRYGRSTLFANARVAFLVMNQSETVSDVGPDNETVTVDDTGLYPGIDVQLRSGVRFRGDGGSFMIYGELERMTDDWVNNDRLVPDSDWEPLLLPSVGVLFSFDRF